MLLLFILCFPRLLLSKTFIHDVPYWMFIVFALGQGNRSNRQPAPEARDLSAR